MKKLLFGLVVLFSGSSFAGWGGAWMPWPYVYQSYYPMSTYGAIAYSPSTGMYGFTYNHYSASQAMNTAAWRCNLPDCMPVVWFAGACGAVASDRQATAFYGWGWANDRYSAEIVAMNECNKRTEGRCSLTAWACSP